MKHTEKHVYENTKVFRRLVETQTPIPVHFEIDGTLIPVEFTLYNTLLKLESAEGLACTTLAFKEYCVDVSDYYYSIGIKKVNCPQLSHEDFFKISNVVAALYGTKLMVGGDHSFKVINGFHVGSQVLSMTKTNGRTFYGKYGFISPILGPAYEKAAEKLKPEAHAMIEKIKSFDGDKYARIQLNEELKTFREKVEAKIDGYIDWTMGEHNMPAQKEPTQFQTLLIVDADGTKVEPRTTPPIIKIIASTLAGGSKRSKKRRKPTRTKKIRSKYNV